MTEIENPSKYRRLTDDVLSNAKCLKVHRSDDLIQAEGEANMLRAWLHVIALGKKVQPKDRASQPMEYKPALKDSHKLYFSDAIREKYPQIIRSYQHYTTHSCSAWTESTVPDTGEAVDVVRVYKLEDFRQWLLSARRFADWAGVGVGGVEVHRNELSRYGRPKVTR